MYRFRHLRNRILFFVLGLLTLLLGSLFLAVNTANLRNARAHVDEALLLTVGILQRSLQEREQSLFQNVRLLSGDYAFKSAFATGDHQTILSALNNHRSRVGADVMSLVTLDEELIADTLHPDRHLELFPFPELLEQAYDSEFGEAADILFIDQRPYQLVVVPLFTPDPSAWIVIGFGIDNQYAMDLQHRTNSHVSLLSAEQGQFWQTFTSTLSAQLQVELEQKLSARQPQFDQSSEMELDGAAYVSLITQPRGSRELIAVLQRPLDAALAPYLALRPLLAAIVAIGLLISFIWIWLIARSVTRPVDVLASAATRIEDGDYDKPVTIRQRDELGALAESFNSMMRGLAERRKVRSLLGKVVSPAIAEELLSREIELGGEERVISILFSDVRGFTSLCESLAPQQVLTLLNRYLSRMSVVIEEHQGVVDKYIGDAVMALFGAPLELAGHEERAVRTALAMEKACSELNHELLAESLPAFRIGIGINSGMVVAGNMGSENRHNYTAIGDAVNLAARVEGLSKQYGVCTIVTDSARNACETLVFCELDRVRVKGKQQPVTIFTPIGESDQVPMARRRELIQHQHALAAYFAGQWQQAHTQFRALLESHPCKLYELYEQRCKQFLDSPPGKDWDGVYTYTQK